jgi:hypothetical protein
MNDGTGKLTNRVVYAGASARAVAVGDLDRDGTPDAVVGSSNGGGVSVLLGRGDGTLAAATNVATTYNLAFLTAGDLNRDGRPDVVSANTDESVTIWTAGCAP